MSSCVAGPAEAFDDSAVVFLIALEELHLLRLRHSTNRSNDATPNDSVGRGPDGHELGGQLVKHHLRVCHMISQHMMFDREFVVRGQRLVVLKRQQQKQLL